MSNGPEQQKDGQPYSLESIYSAREQLDKISSTEANLGPNTKLSDIEKARQEATEKASSVEAKGKLVETDPVSRRSPISNRHRDESYKKTLKSVSQDLTPAGKVFSSFMHNNAVEKASEFLENTIAQPNAILAGAFTAFAITLTVYLVAKTMGYVLSGSETIIAFVVGWVMGTLYNYIRITITGNKK